MSQESIGNTVGASNNTNMNATNLNLQDVIREMDRLLQQRLRPMEEHIKQLEEISLEGQLSSRRHTSEYEEEYAELQHYVEIEDMVHIAMKVERQHKKKGTTRAYGVSSTKLGKGTYKPKSSFTPNERGVPSKNAKHIAETNKGKRKTVPV
ncbi:hypothetical protein V6N11_082835 [Hibiscus sabdariffa]|uniref:Uncharacterized protein n=1 Tax=Hibiscus sabdariffa TaxID=183260 RepID=A0ABR2QK35_9ROSI